MQETFRRLLTWLLVGLPVLAIGDWIALRTETLTHPPWVLAVLALTWLATLIIPLGAASKRVWLGPDGRGQALGRVLFLAGILAALGGGLLNWARALQGFVVLYEAEALPLHQGSHLQEFVPGPLSSIEEMDMVLLLEELELVPTGPDSFYPRSHLVVERMGDAPEKFVVGSRQSGSVGSLRFFQGSFGFAPRIVIREGDDTIFDELVPFETERKGARGVSFAGEVVVEAKGFEVKGALSLPKGISGHGTLDLAVMRDGSLLGRGSLEPGHFAELEGGYQVGFAGLPMWSEIDIARRNYRSIVLAGAGLAVLGSIFWPVAAWRRW